MNELLLYKRLNVFSQSKVVLKDRDTWDLMHEVPRA